MIVGFTHCNSLHHCAMMNAFVSLHPMRALISVSSRFDKKSVMMWKCRTVATTKCSDSVVAGSREIPLPSSDYTSLLGGVLARGARAGDVLCLRGDLGAGKTSLARGYVRAARRDQTLDVTSPTFCLDNTYPPEQWELDEADSAPVPAIHHMDLWRLKSAGERSIVDFEHVFKAQIALIEWPERLGTLLPEERLEVRIVHEDVAGRADTGELATGDDWGFEDEDNLPGRIATLEPHGPAWHARVAAMDLSDILV